MSTAVAVIKHIRGETITFGLRASDPAYDGTETVTCDIKLAVNGAMVPPERDMPVMSVTPAFVDDAWLFTITAAQSDEMDAGNYITDARVVLATGFVDYPEPLGIRINGRVTA